MFLNCKVCISFLIYGKCLNKQSQICYSFHAFFFNCFSGLLAAARVTALSVFVFYTLDDVDPASYCTILFLPKRFFYAAAPASDLDTGSICATYLSFSFSFRVTTALLLQLTTSTPPSYFSGTCGADAAAEVTWAVVCFLLCLMISSLAWDVV